MQSRSFRSLWGFHWRESAALHNEPPAIQKNRKLVNCPFEAPEDFFQGLLRNSLNAKVNCRLRTRAKAGREELTALLIEPYGTVDQDHADVVDIGAALRPVSSRSPFAVEKNRWRRLLARDRRLNEAFAM